METAVAQLAIERHVQLTKDRSAEERRMIPRRAAASANELAGGISRDAMPPSRGRLGPAL
jgi:hypothetical protein